MQSTPLLAWIDARFVNASDGLCFRTTGCTPPKASLQIHQSSFGDFHAEPAVALALKQFPKVPGDCQILSTFSFLDSPLTVLSQSFDGSPPHWRWSNHDSQQSSLLSPWAYLLLSKPLGGIVAEKILVVEDDHLSLKNLRRFLREEGYQVECAGNGNEALTLLEKDKFDLVLSDISMPGIDGYELLTHVRSDFPSMPVILMTGNFSLGAPTSCSGANAFFLKPLDLEKLSHKIEEILNDRSILKNNPSYHRE